MRARLDDTRTAVTGGEAKRSRGHDSPTTCDSVAVPVRRTCVRSYLCTSVHRGDLAATSSCLSLRLELQIRGKPWRHRTPAGRARSACLVVRQGAVGRVAVVVARAGANQIHRVVPASRLRPHQSPDHIERLYLPSTGDRIGRSPPAAGAVPGSSCRPQHQAHGEDAATGTTAPTGTPPVKALRALPNRPDVSGPPTPCGWSASGEV
jgi:hypothetical protein